MMSLQTSLWHVSIAITVNTIKQQPLTAIEVRLYHPRQDKWNDHFVWNEDQAVIIGISPVGRATISCLKINRKEAVNLRKALKAFGVHPSK